MPANQPRRVVPQRDKDPRTGKFLPRAKEADDPRRTGALGGIDLEDSRPPQQRRETLPPPSEYDESDDIDDDADDSRDPDPGHDEERLSRDQTARAFDDVHDEGELGYDHLDDSPPTLLEAPEPRPGFVQRWIRQQIGNDQDGPNVQRANRRGWQPRHPSTLPKTWQGPTMAHGKDPAKIVVEGLVLMEMRKDRFLALRRQIRNRTRQLEEAVHRDLEQVHNQGEGFGTPRMQNTTRVTHGGGRRTVAPADDD